MGVKASDPNKLVSESFRLRGRISNKRTFAKEIKAITSFLQFLLVYLLIFVVRFLCGSWVLSYKIKGMVMPRWELNGMFIHPLRTWVVSWPSHITIEFLLQITQAAQARVSSRSKRVIHESITRCDSVLSYERNLWEFEHVTRNSMGSEMRSIYSDKYFEIWTFYM